MLSNDQPQRQLFMFQQILTNCNRQHQPQNEIQHHIRDQRVVLCSQYFKGRFNVQVQTLLLYNVCKVGHNKDKVLLHSRM